MFRIHFSKTVTRLHRVSRIEIQIGLLYSRKYTAPTFYSNTITLYLSNTSSAVKNQPPSTQLFEPSVYPRKIADKSNEMQQNILFPSKSVSHRRKVPRFSSRQKFPDRISDDPTLKENSLPLLTVARPGVCRFGADRWERNEWRQGRWGKRGREEKQIDRENEKDRGAEKRKKKHGGIDEEKKRGETKIERSTEGKRNISS